MPAPLHLEKIGVTCTSWRPLGLMCKLCGTAWHPPEPAGFAYPAGTFYCPNKCHERKQREDEQLGG